MPTRVVSLVPSATETLLAWGVAPIACTRFCEQPGIRTVGGTKNPDLDAIVGLEPDLVVVDEEENRLEDHDRLLDAGVTVHALHIRSVDDVAPQLTALAEVLGATPGPLAPTLPNGPSVDLPPRRVVVPIWRRPWMVLGRGTYGASLLDLLGLTVVAANGERYGTVDRDELAALRPDLVLVPSEPYDFTDAHLDELRPLAPVVRVDGKDLFWWGARTPAAARRLAAELAR